MRLKNAILIILGGAALLFCAGCSCETLTADQLRIDAATPEYKGMMPAAPAEEWIHLGEDRRRHPACG